MVVSTWLNRLKNRIKRLFFEIFNSTLFKASSIYTISSIINASIPFLLLPILTDKLKPADYGIVAMFQLVVSLTYPFLGLNLEGAIQRKYYDNEKSDFASYVGNCFLLFFSSFIFLSTVFYFFSAYFSSITKISSIWIQYTLIVGAFQFITSILLVIYQVKVMPLKYGVLQISQSIINFVLTFVLVVQYGKSWEGRLEAQLGTAFLFAIISIFILFREKCIKIEFKKKDIINAFSFGLPLIPHAIGGIIFTSIDRFFLTNLLGLEQTGNYSVAYQIGAVISLVTISFNNAYVPWLFDKLNEDLLRIKLKIVKFTYFYFFCLIVFAVVLIIVFPFITNYFVGEKFNDVNTYSVFIIFGFVFQGMYFMVTNYIIYARKTYYQAIVTIGTGLLKLPITYFSIIWFGAVGASVSYCITFFIFFLATWILSNRVYKMPWLLNYLK